MSVQSDAETIKELANKIVHAERLKTKIQAQGGVIYLDDEQEIGVTLTTQQKQDAIAVEESWKLTIKAISGAW